MKCEKCGKINDKDSKFCSGCGEKLEEQKLFCTNCGNEIKSTEAFCAKCGNQIKRSTSSNSNIKNDFYWKKLIKSIFSSFKTFSFGKLIKNILNTKYTMINVLEIIAYIAIFAVMAVFFGNIDESAISSIVFIIIPGLTAFYLAFVGIIIILISWIYQKNLLALLLTGSSSLIGAIALFIFGNNLNNDVEERLNSYLTTMNANPGDEYINYAIILFIVSIILLGLYYFINNKRKKLS